MFLHFGCSSDHKPYGALASDEKKNHGDMGIFTWDIIWRKKQRYDVDDVDQWFIMFGKFLGTYT